MATTLQLAVRAVGEKGSAKMAGLVHDGVYGTDRLKGSLAYVDTAGADLTVTYTEGPTLESMRLGGMGDTGLVRSLPDAFYTGLPVLTPELRGRHWGKYTPSDLAGHNGGPDRHSVVLLKQQVEASVPAFVLDSLLTSADVRRVGTRNDAGRMLTDYRGTVSVTRVAALAASGGAAGRLLPWLKETGMETGIFEVGLSADHLPYAASIRGAFSDGTFAATFTWAGYGTPVHVTPPPVADTWTSADVARMRAKPVDG